MAYIPAVMSDDKPHAFLLNPISMLLNQLNVNFAI